VLRACATRAHDPLSQGLPCAEHSDSRVAARDARFFGVVLDRDAIDLDAAERFGVLGLERFRQRGNALTDGAVQVRVGLGLLLELARQCFQAA